MTAYAKGFESLEAEVDVDQLPLQGELPEWLSGSLLRTGPAKFEAGERTLNHWFDGQAMLHRFSVGEGRVSYQNRFLQTDAYRSIKEEGELSLSEFGTDPCRSIFKRVMTAFSPAFSDNCNVNLTRLGERYIAMTETPIPVEFDPKTLETVGVAYKVPGMLTTAHPHLDRKNGGMINYSAQIGPRNSYRFFGLGPDQEEPDLIAQVPVKEPAYMHSFGLTENWIVLVEFPFVVNTLRLATAGRPYIENYRWKPERGTRITLVDRATGEASGPFITDPLFAFHHINAYEDVGEVVVDLCTYEDASLVEDLYLDRLRGGNGIPGGTVTRLRVDRDSGQVEVQNPLDGDLELPRINYGRCNGRPYRYVWGIGVGDSGWIDSIVRGDLAEGTHLAWREDGCYPGEPIFVARPGAETEDDGVLLSVVLDASTERSFLLVLDAANLTELARAEVPHHIPFSFHGQFDSSLT